MIDTARELFRAWHDVLRFPAGGGRELIYAPFARGARLLPAPRVAVLFACRGFATLDEHAARIAARLGGDRARVRADLAELVEAGLLVGAGELVGRLRGLAPAGEPPAARITGVGVPTRDRVADVHACLASYIENGLAHGRTLEYLVAEGDVSAATREATRASIAELAARHGVPIAHAGRKERLAYAAALARRAEVPPSVAELALCPDERKLNDSGSSRNATLLHFAGDLHLHVDDDTRCRIAPTPGQQPGLALTSQNDPSESWFPPPGEPALRDAAVSNPCFVALHEQLLGRNVAACVEQARGDGLDLDRALASFFRRLEPGGGRVLYTQMGAAGDTGAGSPWHYLLFGGKTRERLLRSEETYRHAFVSRQAVRGATRASISDGSFCLGMTLGIDGRDLTPPFLPVQRNSDGLFGVVVRVCWMDALVGFLPWVVEHTPPGARTSPFEGFFESLGHSWGEDMLCALAAATRVHPEHADPALSLRAMGATLERWGSLPLPEFEEIVLMQVLRARALDLQLLDDTLRAHGGAPAYWARDVERTAALLREAVERPTLARASDLAAALGEEEARTAMQRMVRRYGELCRRWPDLFAAAKELRREGVRVGAAVG